MPPEEKMIVYVDLARLIFGFPSPSLSFMSLLNEKKREKKLEGKINEEKLKNIIILCSLV